MATNKDWLPKSYEEFYDKSTQTRTYLESKFGDFGLQGTSAAWINNVFKPAQTVYSNAFLAWKNPATRTPAIISTIKTACNALVPLYRELNRMLRNLPTVSATDLVQLSLPPRPSGSHTPAPAPTTVPEAKVELPSEGVIVVHFRDSGSDRKGKPAGMHGVEIRWAVANAPLTAWDELVNSAFDTATPYRFSFASELRGKTLSFALRWENTRGEKGGLSQIYSAIIP